MVFLLVHTNMWQQEKMHCRFFYSLFKYKEAIMKELTISERMEVSGGKFRFKWHINPFQVVFTAVGGFLLGGPVGAGIAVGAAIAAQGSGNLHQMYVDEFGNAHQER
jgi:hypothetical protein